MNFPTIPGGAVLRSVSVLLVLGGCLNLSAVADAATLADAPKQSCRYVNLSTVPVKFDNLYATVDADIQGTPSTMLLDTGSELTVLTVTKAVASKLLESGTIPETKDKNGNVVSILRRVHQMAIGGMEAAHQTTLLRIEDKNDLPFDAELGADILFSRDVEMNLSTGEIKFFNPEGCDNAFLAYWDENAGAVDMAKMNEQDHRAVVQVEVNGKTLRAVIDSGTRVSVITPEAAARVGVKLDSPGVVELAQPGDIAGTKAWVATFATFNIGGEVVNHPKIRISDVWHRLRPNSGSLSDEDDMLRLRTDMILGADFMRAHRLLFAVSQQRLYFSYLGGKVFADEGEQKLVEQARPVVQIEFDCSIDVQTIHHLGRCTTFRKVFPSNFEKIGVK
ncbi:MAG TPA: pepsin/retropepsin-like aspartic protease family protein [Burkholderiaceae bacterium]